MISSVSVPPRPPYSRGQVMLSSRSSRELLLPLQPQLPVAVVGHAADAGMRRELADQMLGQPVAHLGPEGRFFGVVVQFHLASASLLRRHGDATAGHRAVHLGEPVDEFLRLAAAPPLRLAYSPTAVQPCSRWTRLPSMRKHLAGQPRRGVRGEVDQHA